MFAAALLLPVFSMAGPFSPLDFYQYTVLDVSRDGNILSAFSADLDGDGISEIYLIHYHPDQNQSTLMMRDLRQGPNRPPRSLNTLEGVWRLAGLCDVDGDQHEDLLFYRSLPDSLDVWAACRGRNFETKPLFGLASPGLGQTPDDSGLITRFARLPGARTLLMPIADLGDRGRGRLVAWHPDQGVVWDRHFPFGVRQPRTVDLDGDGQVEILLNSHLPPGSGPDQVCGEVLLTADGEDCLEQPGSFDCNSLRQFPVMREGKAWGRVAITQDENQTRIKVTEGVDERYQELSFAFSAGAVLTGDIDHDGQDEIVFSSPTGRLHSYDLDLDNMVSRDFDVAVQPQLLEDFDHDGRRELLVSRPGEMLVLGSDLAVRGSMGTAGIAAGDRLYREDIWTRESGRKGIALLVNGAYHLYGIGPSSPLSFSWSRPDFFLGILLTLLLAGMVQIAVLIGRHNQARRPRFFWKNWHRLYQSLDSFHSEFGGGEVVALLAEWCREFRVAEEKTIARFQNILRVYWDETSSQLHDMMRLHKLAAGRRSSRQAFGRSLRNLESLLRDIEPKAYRWPGREDAIHLERLLGRLESNLGLFEREALRAFTQQVPEALYTVIRSLPRGSDQLDRLQVHVEPEGLDVPVIFEKSALFSVIENVITNAIEAMADSEERILRFDLAIASPNFIALTVSDSGPGLSPERAATIFDYGVSSKGPGRGKGLAITRELMDRFGGEIEVLPPDPKQSGARFRLKFLSASLLRSHASDSKADENGMAQIHSLPLRRLPGFDDDTRR